MKRRSVIQLGLLVLAAIVASAVVAALAFGGSTAESSASAPPVTTSGQLNINGTTINVQSFSAGAANPTSISAGGLVGGKASFSSLNLETAVDASYPVLYQAVGLGQKFPTATLTFTWGSPNGSTATATYQLENVIVESLQQSGGSGDAPLESMSLAFETVHWTFTDANGTTTRGWNLVTNVPLP